MGIFTRRPRDGNANEHEMQHPQHAADNSNHRGRHQKSRSAPVVVDMSRRPTFGQWLKATWLDIFTMAAMGMIGLGVGANCFILFCTSASLSPSLYG